MPKLKENALPAYRLHKQSGQAIVTLNGKDYVLGSHGSPDSKAEYRRLTAEWIANGRRATVPTALIIAELIVQYRTHCLTYYRRSDGTPTSEQDNIRQAMRPLRELYGSTVAGEFGPLALEVVRNDMIQRGWCRRNINKQIARIKQFFKWCASKELIPVAVYQAICTVNGLRAGRTDARESMPIMPVADHVVDATLPHLSSVIRAMVQLQRYTGARPGEICSMKVREIDRTGEVWTYHPASHKTAHHGRERVIHIGKRGQAVLASFVMKLDPAAYVFSPAEAVAEMRQHRAEARTTPLSCGNRPGTKRRQNPRRTIGENYDVKAYRRAIARACDAANDWEKGGKVVGNDERLIPRWHPHQLRHTAATDIRRQFGIEAAQHTLGHATLKMTEVYAEKNAEIAKRVAAAMG